MKNYIQEGRTLTVTAPAGVASGELVVVGRIVGVAAFDAVSGAEVEVVTEGVFTLPKVTGTVVTAGDALYWDAAAKQLTPTPGTGSKPLVGYAVRGAAAADATVDCRVVPTLQTGPA